MAKEYKNLGKIGWVKEGTETFTFSIGSATSPNDPSLVIDPLNNIFPDTHVLLQVDNFSVLSKGALNNGDNIIQKYIRENKLLPELIEKQVRIMYGRGPMVYKTEINDNKVVRKWEKVPEIQDWLDGFEKEGVDSYKRVAKQIIRRYYYFEDFYCKMRMRATRFLDFKQRKSMNLPPPVVAFEFVENKRSRLASTKKIDFYNDDVEERDFNYVLVGNWSFGNTRSYKKYRKLNVNNILRNSVGISHHKSDSVGEIYGLNKWFEGIKEWISGSNLTPTYINSFFKNIMAAKIHIVVPNEWCDLKREMLKNYCEINAKRVDADENADLIRLKLNDGTYLELGTEFHEALFSKYFKNEVERCVQFLSGPENQGKAHTTISFKDDKGNESQWKFEPIDLKQKEYVESRLKYDERADDVQIAALGIPPSISHMDKSGIISKSGADVYYNYVIYLHTLTPAEEICMEPFNLALQINFPDLYAEGYRIGLYNDIPQRQEDTAPKDRITAPQTITEPSKTE